MKILIVEDDENISELLSDELCQWGYETRQIKDFTLVLEEYENFEPHLVLMDVTLPSFNGFYWTQQIRKISNIPIIFISSHTNSIDTIQAIQFGADEYIVKPINIPVTRAKIQAILRRTYDYALTENNINNTECILYHDLMLNFSTAKLEGENFSISLTRTELLIMEILFKMKNKIAKREEIINHCWQSDNFIDDNTLAVNITRLRKKLYKTEIADLIQTKKGIGYFLNRK